MYSEYNRALTFKNCLPSGSNPPDTAQTAPAAAATAPPPVAKTIEEAESIFSALPAPKETVRRARRGSSAPTPPGAGSASGRQAVADAQDERTCPEVEEEEESSEEDSWAEMQGMSPDANLWRQHPEHGLQRIRLSSKFVAKHLQHQQDVSDTPPALMEDPDYPGVELSTGKVTDKGVFESVKARQQFIDLAEDIMEEKLDPRILAHGGKVKMMWWPDEPVFYNVTQRRRIPMALPPNVRQPLYDDPNLLLREACKNGEELEVIRQARAGADVNHTDTQFSHFTPLHWACWYGRTAVVRALLKELGAYPFPRDRSDETPWHTALMCQRFELAEEMERMGAGFPIMHSLIPLNKSAANEPFTCTNEYLNPSFPTSDLYRTYNLRFAQGCFDSQLLPPSVEV